MSLEDAERFTPAGTAMMLSTRTDTNDGAIAHGILLIDEYQLEAHRPMSGWAIDIGAHIGTIALAMAIDNPDLSVVAVEALAENVELIRRNVAKNDLADRVFVEGRAATDDDEAPVDITYNYRFVGVGRTGESVDPRYLSQCRFVGNIFQDDGNHEQDSDIVSVPGISLETLIAKYQMERVTFLKIDCEGCEYAFLASKAIDKVDFISGEYHDARSFSDLVALLDATHIVTQVTDIGPVGIFTAIHR